MDELDTPAYWGTAQATRYIPASDYVARMRAAEREDAKVSRCSACGQWSWGGDCTLHPAARQDRY